ncbi:MAG: dUTP diphosphatase [Candidatus Gracilibacteria bacterium]|nr:dUTP diphosphatase [Candidatus Gracilibacteria bacterium]
MKVRIKSLDGKGVNYETTGACAFDFRCMNEEVFEPGEFKLVETGLVVETPKGYMLQTQPRSSTYKKYGLIQVNSVGIIDNDYCGDNDTIKFPFYNLSGKKQVLEAGTRIGQGVFVKIETPEFEIVDCMNNCDRGGFGTTGVK